MSALCLVLSCLINCGLDEYYYLNSPSAVHTTFNSDDYMQRYFSFLTSESGTNATYINSDAGFIFLGTEVYYKIYNNYSTAYSHYSKVLSYNSSSSSYSAAADYILDTLGYKTLRLSYGSYTPLIPATGTNTQVYIRLTSYYDEEEYACHICVGSSTYDSSTELTYNGTVVYPRRYINYNYGFDFDSDDTSNPVPSSGDSDVYYSTTSTSSGTWYVALYAVSLGRDTTYTTSYSNAIPLGIVPITVDAEN